MAHMFNAGIELTFTGDNIAILRMRNGENRIDRIFTEAFSKALDTVERNSDCRALITTAEGKFYSNGLNLEFLKGKERYLFGLLCLRVLTFPVVTVAAINGHAFAGGALLALYHDFRVMQTKRGWISLNEVFIKAPLSGNMPLLRAKLSGRASHDLAVLGKRYTAEEARDYGIVDVATSSEDLMSSARSLVNQYTSKQKYDRDTLKAFKEDLYREVVDAYSSLMKSRL
ncbi:uncharacterized protein [Haliotis cracherodii]|uniref:uncharacterized protein n=1 Tax=Haliotis cracherodii TaxID=6455 RepID=UPI0039E87DA3